ncbi:two-component regulator propeller domain-containing protein [Xylanibacter ruminicola]|uniref:histidine kinase n=1 Tax=Xylanibacter ruminicola TaxID=839 RepID=A0A1M6RCE4_XYLRU|nr:two-component regulator propeller domain-containing protein [Xylanibacter ruminicola]SHK30131.1 Two component regulator propeller [Xylanibacter ruminicola]
MNIRKLLTSIICLVCLTASAATAVIPDMKFRHLDARDGLSNSQINYLFQDSRGFIWIGTSYGLNRYDGYRFRTFYSDPNDSTTLRNNYIDQIWEDGEGKLWLKQGMNYSVFDPVTEKVNRNPITILSKLGIKGGIDRFYIDSQKRFWVKTYDEGLYCYNPRKKSNKLIKYGYEAGEINKEYYFSNFAEWNDKLLVTSSDGELMVIDGDKGQVILKDDFMKNNGGQPSQPYYCYVDKHSNYWVATTNRQFIFSQKDKTWYKSLNEYLGSLGIAPLPGDMQVWDVCMDQRGWVWLATDHQGIFVIDTKNANVKNFVNNKFDNTSISENTQKKLMLDKTGNMWIACYRNGLNQYIEKLMGFNTLEIGDVNTTTVDANGNFWFGTDNRGIIKYVRATGETEVYDKARCGFASETMVSSLAAKDGSVWFGTYNGGIIHISNGQIKNYTMTNTDGQLLNNNVWSITEDKWGDIWIGTLGSGVQKLNPKTGKFRAFNMRNSALPSDFMTSEAWTKKGWLMVGHSEFYSLINPVSGKVANIKIPAIKGQMAAMASTTCVVEDSRGLVWHGSTAGCCVVDMKTNKQHMLDMNSGLLGSSVVGIIEDKLHTMWVITEHGVSNVVLKKDEQNNWIFNVRSFSSKDGLQQGPYNQRSVSVTPDGLILVGGLGGVDVINPSLVTNVDNTETPIFSGLKLFGQQLGVGEEYDGRVIMDEDLNTSKELVLRYYENQFTIQLATDKGEMHNTSRFVYMLEGFSDKWVKTEENDPNITYMSLHHGSYVLHVRMLNEDGTMGKNEAILNITITPPLLRNRWIMVIFLALVALAIFLWRRMFLKRQAEKTERDYLRMEVMKKQWMSEMRVELQKQQESDQKAQAEELAAQAWTIEETHKKPHDLQHFMKEQCAKFKAPLGKHVKFSFFPLANDLTVDFDRDQMAQAVQMILSNSALFSPTDCKIKVFVDKTSTSGTIRISDNGVGIPEGAEDSIFDPMISDDDSGMSLFFVKAIVEMHGGTITAENNPSGGSIFTITLPVEEASVEEAVMMEDDD